MTPNQLDNRNDLFPKWKKSRESVLNEFEAEMLERSAIKVRDSAAAAEFLHSELVLAEGDAPRGRILKKEDF